MAAPKPLIPTTGNTGSATGNIESKLNSKSLIIHIDENSAFHLNTTQIAGWVGDGTGKVVEFHIQNEPSDNAIRFYFNANDGIGNPVSINGSAIGSIITYKADTHSFEGTTIIIPPTSDPLIAGALWNNNGVPTFSEG